jgi:rhodanese-related sulfurtransferase
MTELLRELALALVVAVVRIQFADVPVISSRELAGRLTGQEGRPPVLIDTREPREYAVSHLPGALNLPTLQAVRRAAVPMDAEVVVYCTVGYRSAHLARQLQDAGYTDVANLQGSIVAWHNEGLPLVSGGIAVDRVHPYDAFWGRLLEPGSLAYR